MRPNGPPRTIWLKERRARECRLPPADVAFLLDEHRDHVELAPTCRRHVYRLTPAGHVGTIVGPARRLVIRPKVPVRNLFHLLDPNDTIPCTEDQVTAVPGTEILDFLAGRLVALLRERAAAGLHRAYTERAGCGPFVQGRLDLAAQLRDPGHRKDRLHCLYEDFTVDVPCNQVARATAELVLGSPLVGDGIKASLRQILPAFAEVTLVPLSPELFLAAGPTRLTEAYRPLLDLCRLLADGLTAGPRAGPTACPAFLLDMEGVFERYVTAGVAGVFPQDGRYQVSIQQLITANRPAPGRPDLHLRPDITIDRGGRPVRVIDAKWKRLKGSPLVTEDVYQVLAYCTALGVNRGILVYPGRRDRRWVLALRETPIRVEIFTLRVTATGPACKRSLERFVRRAARGLE